MTGLIDPITGNLVGMSGSMGGFNQALQPPIRAFASRPDCAQFAHALEQMANTHGRYFTANTGAPQPTAAIITEGERLNLWRKADGKDYWKFTNLTWSWIRTAIALDY